MINNNLIKAGIIGSSWPATIITILYISRAFLNTQGTIHNIQFENAAVIIPLIFAFWNTVAVAMITQGPMIFKDYPFLAMLFFGALNGLTMSSLGTYTNANKTLMKFELDYIQFPASILLYSFIFGAIIYNLNRLFEII